MATTPSSSTSTPIDDARTRVLGLALAQTVRASKLLVIGAGGIGCELLKNLVLTGFELIEIIDLDTIDVSNLNRQFLFRARHVGQPKAVVAREVVLGFNPHAAETIVAHHANVKDPQFGLDYFQQFSIVLNALDNIDARRHVNRMCLATGKPMIDAGTTGYVGQVNVIKKGEAACYECEEKATQKVYPICTIRSTPDKPVHCVVWAKEAFKLVFGPQDASLLFEAPDAPEPSLYMPVVSDRPEQGEGEKAAVRYGVRVLKALFYQELEAQVAKGLYKSKQIQPVPVACLGGEGGKTEDEWVERVIGSQGKQGGGGVASSSTSSSLHNNNLEESERNGNPTRNGKADWTRQVWGPEVCVLELLRVFAALYGDPARRQHVGAYEFDKDDLLAMRFVAAATNLRAASFGIPAQSFHDTKGIAGNIVPAIATTNAMAAGLQVLEALKILRAALLSPSLPPSLPSPTIVDAACKVNYIVRAYAGRKRLLLQPTALHPPNPACFVCNRSRIDLMLDTQTTTLAFLVEKILKAKLSFAQPSVLIGGNIIYEEGEDADEALAALNLPKPLSKLPAGGIKHETMIEIDDMSQELTLQINVYHQEWAEWEAGAPPEGFLLGGGAKEAIAAAAAAASLQKEIREKAQGLYAKQEEAKESLRVGGRGGIKKKREEEEMAARAAGGGEETEGPAGGQAKRPRLAVEGGGDTVVVVEDEKEHTWTKERGEEGGGDQEAVICLD